MLPFIRRSLWFSLGAVWFCSQIFAQETAIELKSEIKVELGPAEPLPQQLYTFNTDMMTAIAWKGVGYDSPQFEDAIAELRPQGLRFPGGTLANNYLWSEDALSEPTNDMTGWAAEQIRSFRKIGRSYDLPGFARVVRRHQLTPIWVLNVYEETPESVLALFEKLDSLGMNVTSVEMANEPYWDGRSLANVRSYLDASRPIAQALRKHRPEVKVGACFAPFGNPANYEAIWNGPLAKETWFDAIVFHEYYGGQGFALEEGQAIPKQAMLFPEAMIDTPIAKLGELMADKPVWLTEWNVGVEGLDQWKNTGAELLYIAAMFTRLIDHRDTVTTACFHASYDERFGAFYIDNDSGQVETNASFELFRMLGTIFAGTKQLRPIAVSEAELRGFATQAEDDVRLFLVNRGEASRTVVLPDEVKGDHVQMTIDAAPNKKLPRSTPLAVSTVIGQSSVTLPPYSISLIGRRESLEFQPKRFDDENLFPRRPDLVFWYPPYASTQPTFNGEGVYAIKLDQCKDKQLAVLKMNLTSSKLEAGREYAVEFDARSSIDGGFSVKLPQAASDSSFSLLGDNYQRLRYTFRYDRAANDGEVVFVFPPELISSGATVSLRNFLVRAVD